MPKPPAPKEPEAPPEEPDVKKEDNYRHLPVDESLKKSRMMVTSFLRAGKYESPEQKTILEGLQNSLRITWEEVAAAVVLRDGKQVSERELRDFASKRLADFKVPRKIVFLPEIPKGATGKLQRIGLAGKLGLVD